MNQAFSNPTGNNEENKPDIFDLIIKFTIPLIVIIVIALPLIIFKPWRLLNLKIPGFRSLEDIANVSRQSNEMTKNYIEISEPVYSLIGTVAKIEGDILTVTSSKGIEIPLKIDSKVSITLLLPTTSADQNQIPTKPITLSDLKKGQNLTIFTLDDLRFYNGSPVKVSTIAATDTEKSIFGLVKTVSEQTLSIADETDDSKSIEIAITPTTEITLSQNGTATTIQLKDILPNDAATIFSSGTNENNQIVANKINLIRDFKRPVMGTVKEISPSSIQIERQTFEDAVPYQNLTVLTTTNTEYLLVLVSQKQTTPSTRDLIRVGDTINIESKDFDPGSSQATADLVRIYHLD